MCTVVCNAFPVRVVVATPVRIAADRCRGPYGEEMPVKVGNVLWSQTAWVEIVTLPLVSYVTLVHRLPL